MYLDTTKKEKILIVDDTVDTVELLKKRFRADGYETAEAYDGEEGLRKVAECQPDLVVLDVMMPKLDGYAVCKCLKNDEATRHLPVLMLTAKSETSDKVKGLDIGADDYIAKPFDYKELVARVRSLLMKKNISKKMAEREKSEALDSLVDEVSHEVRNPLVAIGGFARRVYKNLAEDDENRRYMEIILQNVESLEKMVMELIELKGATFAYQESLDINSALRMTLAMFSKEVEEQQIEVVTKFAEGVPSILADREKLTRALFNIIENAIEAMVNSPRKLLVATKIGKEVLEIEITDNGHGCSRSTLKRMYDPFISSKIYGPGLGLTFCLKVIQNHRGTISVVSEEGIGTTFTIKLPAFTGP